MNSIDALGLKQAEEIYRAHLRAQPDNMALRLSLAWCLFLQASHQSAQNSVLSNDCLVDGLPDIGADAANEYQARSPRALLRDCLDLTYTMKWLSTDSDFQQAVDSLQELAELTCGHNLSEVVEARLQTKLVRLASAVARSADSDLP